MIGNRIRLARTQAGMTADELAKALDVDKSQISHWEAGRKEPEAKSIVKLANALAVTSDYLLGLSNRP